MERIPVTSSNVAAVAHDPELLVLEVQYHPNKSGEAAVWQYCPVEKTYFDTEIMGEYASVGRAVTVIKTSTIGRKVAVIGPDGVERAVEEANAV